jgi:6-phosphogluconolactonase
VTVPRPARHGPAQLIVGTYTERLPFVDGTAEGILGCDYRDGVVGPPRLLAPARNPSWVTITDAGDTVYAVHETTEFAGRPGGGITAYARDQRSGELRKLGSRPSAGCAPAHAVVYQNAAGAQPYVLVANYDSGSVASFPADRRGGLGELAGHAQHAGSSVNPDRQAGPHAHMVGIDPVTSRVLVPDLGLDLVLSYQIGDGGALIEQPGEHIATRPGAGPRHLAFHPAGQFLFLLTEIDSTLMALRRGPAGFAATDTVSTLPAGCTTRSEAAAVRVAASGRYVFASNRGYDSVAMFALDESSGTLSLAAVAPSGGREPRDFCQTPDGGYLLVANQDSHSIVSLAIDEAAATLTPASATSVSSPVCLLFAP